MMKDRTNIEEKFKDINKVAEEDYSDTLQGHYQLVKEKLTAEHEELLALEQALLSRATEEVAENHRRLREMTDQNLLREKNKIDESKKRKIEALKNPTTKRGRGGNRRGGRGEEGRVDDEPERPRRDEDKTERLRDRREKTEIAEIAKAVATILDQRQWEGLIIS